MADDELQLVDLAVNHRLLTRKQAELIREEISMFPGELAGEVMLRRHYITEEQLEALRAVDAGDEGSAELLDSSRRITEEEARSEPEHVPGEPSTADSRRTSAALAENPRKRLAYLLRVARHWGASDLHLSTGRPPFVRMFGQIRYMEEPPLTSDEAEVLNFAGLTEDQARQARKDLQLDFALEIPRLGRHRCNIFHQRLGWDGSYRIVGARIPTLHELGLPSSLRIFTEYHQGLVMITGRGGSGKTSTTAALLDMVNANRSEHIITVEDPVEYVLAPKACQITQREVGRHTESFATALRAALREDPDIIMIGELRDFETTSISITAAETGHLVFATLNTSSAARTVAKLVDFYPTPQQPQILNMVSESLRGVITQQLVPRRTGDGVVPAIEIMLNTSGIAQQIREGKTHLISSLIQGGKKYGMMLMDESLMNLLHKDIISGREAYRRAGNKPAFEEYKEL